MLDFFTEFPEISRSDIRDIKTSIDNAFRSFSRNYGESIENFFDPLLWFLIWIEKLLLNTPWPIIILIIALLEPEFDSLECSNFPYEKRLNHMVPL